VTRVNTQEMIQTQCTDMSYARDTFNNKMTTMKIRKKIFIFDKDKGSEVYDIT
jgi:hypothetical protein